MKLLAILVVIALFQNISGKRRAAKNNPIINSPKGECPKLNSQKRVDAGYAGITKEVCKESGNCWDDETPQAIKCYRPYICDDDRVDDRKNAGSPGITRAECVSKGNCYDSTFGNTFSCYLAFMCYGTNPQNRIDIGYTGITKKECLDSGGCFDESTPKAIKCYKPQPVNV